MINRLVALSVTAMIVAACQPESIDPAPTTPIPDADVVISERLAVAEQMIDAFYSFDIDRLRPFLTEAGDAEGRILYYQGWAEGGNYKIIKRTACFSETPEKIICPITVEDDPVLALKLDFKVTDTFAITFDGLTIKDIQTSSDDKPVYSEARKWVVANLPAVMEGPCRGRGMYTEESTPADCARAMTAGYAQFAESDDFPN